ncbi:MAG: serine/threonine-protein kinase [Luteimonas sp.]|nr:serine/threonine-protein kinase [Luteimonas sp.]
MEHVEGPNVIDWADGGRLGLRARILLFLRACAAVQYAHERFVVHRDLKPANILVDVHGQPKVLDFGVAKRIDARAGATRTGMMAGFTPEYAAPEQITGGPVSAGTDVYGLGVVLYQLLSGNLPYVVDQQNIQQAFEAITSRTAVQMSTALTAGSEEEVARRLHSRRTDPGTFRRFVKGDLSRIIQTALAKEPERRYSSVKAFSDDLQSFLAGRPVSVSGDTFSYRAGKFARRNKGGVALATATVLALVMGLAGTLWQASEAAREAELAGEVERFLVGLFESNEPGGERSEMPDTATLLGRGVNRARTELAGQAELQARMLGVLGKIHYAIGKDQEAKEQLEEALSLYREVGDKGSPGMADTLFMLSDIASEVDGDYPHALALAEESLAMVRGKDVEREINTRGRVSIVAQGLDDYERAKSEARTALALARSIEQPEGKRVAQALSGLAWAHNPECQTNPDVPIRLHREALELLRRAQPEIHFDTSNRLYTMSSCMLRAGRLADAEGPRREALDIARKVFGDADHQWLMVTLWGVGVVLDARGDYAGAEPVMRERMEMTGRMYGNEHPAYAASVLSLGVVLSGLGRPEEALALVEPHFDRLGEENRLAGRIVHTRIAIAARRWDEAEVAIREGLELAGDDPRSSAAMAGLRSALGEIRVAQGLADQALALVEPAVASGTGTGASQHQNAVLHVRLGEARQAMGQWEKAREAFLQALDIGLPELLPQHPAILRARLGLAMSPVAPGGHAEVLEQGAQALAASRQLPERHPLRVRAEAVHACLAGGGADCRQRLAANGSIDMR